MKPYTLQVREILYMTSENEFIAVYAGLMMSEDGLRARPNTQETMIAGTMKYVADASVRNALRG